MKDVCNGSIITFYSYKGGVGRTMAVANLAHMAAYNGKRVLVMDWDLEAPGLAYYFRGMMGSEKYKNLKLLPGVLDLLCEWQEFFTGPDKDIDRSDEFIDDFRHGSRFSQCLSSVADPDFLPNGGALDYIGPGAQIIRSGGDRPYEEALAKFSWAIFFEATRGGLLLAYLRAWAKANYDFIFIDSRTGLADIAGICTTQLPDVVALCFVLNRQNIDGVARLAGSIRLQRNQDITIRAIPMRVARQNTSEESDARARAISAFSHVGGIQKSLIEDDIRQLAIPQTESVPFQETLAAFSPIELDLLVFSYLRLAEFILKIEVERPKIDKDLAIMVLKRTAPRLATTDYLDALLVAEPGRAFEELLGFLNAALEDDSDESELTDEYTIALINTAFSINSRGLDFSQLSMLQRSSLTLLRKQYLSSDAEFWPLIFARYLEQYVMHRPFPLDIDEELATFDELDELLLEIEEFDTRIKRVQIYKKSAGSCLASQRYDGAMQRVGQLFSLIKESRKSRTNTPEEEIQLLIAEMEGHLIAGDVQTAQDNSNQAIRSYESGLAILDRSEYANLNEVDVFRIKSTLHLRVAIVYNAHNDLAAASNHAIQSAYFGRNSRSNAYYFPVLAEILINANVNNKELANFCRLMLGVSAPSPDILVSSYISIGSAGRTLKFLQVLDQIIVRFKEDRSAEVQVTIPLLMQASEIVLKSLGRRRQTLNSRVIDEIDGHAVSLRENLSSFHRD